jgi:4-hydroxy-tetrahydrodipicolinate synthase
MLSGVITPMITIFDQENNIDYQANQELVDYLISSGVDGILIFGSIGEFFSLSLQQKKKYLKYIIEAVNGRVPLLVGSASNVMEEVLELNSFAAANGADALVILEPYFFDLDQESAERYYLKATAEADLPCYIYNFPARTGVNLGSEFVLKLLEERDNIVGLKDSVTTFGHTRKLINQIRAQKSDFEIFSGFDEFLIPNLMLNGNGVIGGLSNVVPKLFAELIKAYQQNNLEKIKLLNQKLSVLMEIYELGEPFIKAIKTAVAVSRKEINTSLKFPMGKSSVQERKAIAEVIKRAAVEEFL